MPTIADGEGEGEVVVQEEITYESPSDAVDDFHQQKKFIMDLWEQAK